VDIPINKLAILCVAKILCGEGYEAKGILISPMYIYIKMCGGLWGVGGVGYPKYRQALDKIIYCRNSSDNI
jgi:hypothetical protein